MQPHFETWYNFSIFRGGHFSIHLPNWLAKWKVTAVLHFYVKMKDCRKLLFWTFLIYLDPETVKKAQEAYQKKLAEKKAAEDAKLAEANANKASKKDVKKGKKKWSHLYIFY